MAEISGGKLRFSGQGIEEALTTPSGEILPGHLHGVGVRIVSISRGSVAVWVGGRRSKFFTTPGEHADFFEAGNTGELKLVGICTDAVVDEVTACPMFEKEPA